jgi:hypothetical protein
MPWQHETGLCLTHAVPYAPQCMMTAVHVPLSLKLQWIELYTAYMRAELAWPGPAQAGATGCQPSPRTFFIVHMKASRQACRSLGSHSSRGRYWRKCDLYCSGRTMAMYGLMPPSRDGGVQGSQHRGHGTETLHLGLCTRFGQQCIALRQLLLGQLQGQRLCWVQTRAAGAAQLVAHL